MFAFGIWDRQEKQLFLARDPMGVKPLYYYRKGTTFVFASETRAMLATDLMPKKVSVKALVEYFNYQSVSYPYSPVEDILQLQAGSWMKVTREGIECKAYWDVFRASQGVDVGDAGLVQKKIRDLMLQSIERRLVSDVPVGAFLSGGIDSSAVVGLMAEAGPSRPNTFNISFEEKEFDESGYADQIVAKFNTHHTRILLKPTVFLDELQNALNAMDTPSGDGINTFVVSKAIRQNGMTVALSGIGGDELFAGYPFFSQYCQLQGLKDWWKTPLTLRKWLAGMLYPGHAEGKKGKMKQLLQLPAVDIGRCYPVFRQILSPWLLNELTVLAEGAAPLTSVAAGLAAHRQELDKMPLLSQVSAAEYLGYTQHTLLKDTDQMSMAVSLEVREPFFDQDLVAFILGVPDKIKKTVYPKSLLVESLKPLLPDTIVHRKKQGFLFPWEVWLKNELRSFGDMHIRNMAHRPFIRSEQLLGYWNRFLAGDKNVRWSELWLFIVLDYWLEKNGLTC
jgi:asparagine synthase (glutamine-hydrolysing)